MALQAFSLAMVMFPHVVAKAQAELDSVIGTDRLPAFSDRERLPYVTAIMYETIRWHTVGPFGKCAPHA